MSLEDRDGNGEEEEEEEEEWSGVYGFNNHDHEMDKEAIQSKYPILTWII